MHITVQRTQLLEDRTLSEIIIDTVFFCYGLEDTMREKKAAPIAEWKVWGKTAIPVGMYDVVINWSNRFKRQMIEVLRVPGFAGIRIHNGKGPESTDGCLIVSMTKEFDYSRDAMHAIEQKVLDALTLKEKVTIEFRNPSTTVEVA